MDYNQLFEQIKAKKSFLCVGLDSDIAKIPPHLLQMEDPEDYTLYPDELPGYFYYCGC